MSGVKSGNNEDNGSRWIAIGFVEEMLFYFCAEIEI